MSNTSAKSGGIGFFGILGLIFIGLKLAEVGAVATWSWWWVLSPLWGPLVVGFGLWAVFAVIVCIITILRSIADGISNRSRLASMMRD
jgi:hypothetical protein